MKTTIQRATCASLLGILLGSACSGREQSAPRSSAGEAGQSFEVEAGTAGQPAAAGQPAGAGGDRGASGGSTGEGVGGQPDSMAGAGGQPESMAGTAGDAGQGGMPTDPAIPPGTGTIGSPCDATIDCEVGLQCITESMATLNGASPPNGLCTRTCTSDQQCAQSSPGAVCYPFDTNSFQGYCVEGCAFEQQSVFRKCHARLDFSCMPALLTDTGFSCVEGCIEGEICQGEQCVVVIPACLPTCRGDLDCPPGRYCDQSWLSGTCVTEKPTGKSLGAPCTVPGPLDPVEPDECLGYCQPDAQGSSAGHCSSSCGITNGCDWDPQTQRFGGACYYPSVLTENGAVADFGYCTPTCSCAAECDIGVDCYALSGLGPLDQSIYAAPGLCFDSLPDPVVDTCQ